MAWGPGSEELVTTTSSDPIEETLPLTLKKVEESSAPEAAALLLETSVCCSPEVVKEAVPTLVLQ